MVHWYSLGKSNSKYDYVKVIEWSMTSKGHVKGHLQNQIKSKGFYQLCKSKGFFATHLYSVLAVYYYLLRTPKKNSPVPIQFIFNHLIWEFERSEQTSTRKNFLLIIQETTNQTTAIMYNPHKGKPKTWLNSWSSNQADHAPNSKQLIAAYTNF